jgi:hypothetical protein
MFMRQKSFTKFVFVNLALWSVFLVWGSTFVFSQNLADQDVVRPSAGAGIDTVMPVPPGYSYSSPDLDDVTPKTPTVSVGWSGVDGTPKDGFFHKPPDTHIAVGTGAGAAGRVVMVTNSGIQIWDKAGSSITTATPLNTFLSLVAPAGFDPKVLFDQHSGRFFIVILNGKTPNPAGTSDVHIAVSSNSTPNNLTTDWTKLVGSALTNIGGTETWFDYPGIGADSDSLFITGNMFSTTTSIGIKIRVFDKAALIGGTYTYVDIDVDSGVTPGVFTAQPAHTYGTTDSGNFYLINRYGSTAYRLWEITGDPGAPTIVSNSPRGWTAGAQLTSAPQSGSAITIDTLSSRIMNAVYRSGNVWCALSSDMDIDSKTEVAWFKIATNGGSPSAPTVADSGYIDGSDGDEWTFMPSINVNASGDVTICYSQSFSDQFVEMRYVSHHASDDPGTFQESVVAATSVGFYDAFSVDDPDRWGDYSACVVDPDDDETFWIANEIVQTSAVDTSIWGTYIAKLNAVLTPVGEWPMY